MCAEIRVYFYILLLFFEFLNFVSGPKIVKYVFFYKVTWFICFNICFRKVTLKLTQFSRKTITTFRILFSNNSHYFPTISNIYYISQIFPTFPKYFLHFSNIPQQSPTFPTFLKYFPNISYISQTFPKICTPNIP